MASATAKQYAAIAAWIMCGFVLHSALHSKYLHSTCYNQEVVQLKRLAAYVGGYHSEATAVTENPETTTTSKTTMKIEKNTTTTTETAVAITKTDSQKAPAIRILCLILTTPENHLSKARHVKATWGRRCTKLLFMSSKADEDLGAVALGVGDGRQKLWAKSRAAFLYVYKHHMHEADWFLKADDDTYVVMENLRHLLSVHNSSEPHYFGGHLRLLDEKNETFPGNGYMSGGSGYVISKEALRKFVEHGILNGTTCFQGDSYAEDVAFGQCLEYVGVKPDDSRDLQGYTRFVPYPVKPFMQGETDAESWWYRIYFYDQTNDTAYKCCSESAISFHYVKPAQMHLFEYFIYQLKVYGLS